MTLTYGIDDDSLLVWTERLCANLNRIEAVWAQGESITSFGSMADLQGIVQRSVRHVGAFRITRVNPHRRPMVILAGETQIDHRLNAGSSLGVETWQGCDLDSEGG